MVSIATLQRDASPYSSISLASIEIIVCIATNNNIALFTDAREKKGRKKKTIQSTIIF